MSYLLVDQDIADTTMRYAPADEEWSVADVVDYLDPGAACHQEVDGGVIVFETIAEYSTWSQQV